MYASPGEIRFQDSGCMPVQETSGQWMNASPGEYFASQGGLEQWLYASSV